ncbi:MAG: hypothetical protein JW765_08530 [Deltaproteobacteria bacterium]|nr:hypothetical protein [Candidatus Zymogenaceae bacterium]
MGIILRGLCGCGYDTGDMFIGGGFTNFMDTCNAPAVCLQCSELVIRNYAKRGSARCHACRSSLTFYDDSSLHDPSPENEVSDYLFVWRISGKNEYFKLPDTNYLCPKCRNMTLVFKDKGHWD